MNWYLQSELALELAMVASSAILLPAERWREQL
jgi:hypothetical protein